MKSPALLQILTEKPPVQFEFLERLLELFSQSPALEAAYVRGSIARNDYDRASDLDLVLLLRPDLFETTILSLDLLMRENFGALFPGWLDRIVPSFGGMGFVYLVDAGDKLLQLDLYLLPSSREERIRNIPGARKVLDRATETPAIVSEPALDAFIGGRLSQGATVRELLIEAVVLSHLLRKRIQRRQDFLNHSETVLLNQTLRELVRAIFDPEHRGYGWYHLKENLSRHADSARWCRELERIVLTSPTRDAASLAESLEFAERLAREENPSALAPIEPALNHYLKTLKENLS